MINYGAPRVANKYYAEFFDEATKKSSKRFIVKGDPIVVLPECLTPICNYKHTGNQYDDNDFHCFVSPMACFHYPQH